MHSVSVIIPVRDRRDLIVEAVDSVREQTLSALEILVIDDGSVDGTPDAVEGLAPNVRIVRQPTGGRSSARNRRIAQTRGSLIAFLDPDDPWPPGQPPRQVC